MKKFISIFLLITILFGISGCTQKDNQKLENSSTPTSTQVIQLMR